MLLSFIRASLNVRLSAIGAVGVLLQLRQLCCRYPTVGASCRRTSASYADELTLPTQRSHIGQLMLALRANRLMKSSFMR